MKRNNDLANDTIVTTVMSNKGLYEALKRQGIRYEKDKSWRQICL